MLNDNAIKLISQFEGLRLKAYPDPGSRDGTPWTIGYGHTKGVKPGMVITKEEAEEFLREDLKHAEFMVRKHVKVPINENQYGALVSFVFNCGGTAFARSTLLKRINANKFESVPEQFMKWVNNDGRRMKGLVRRRAAEVALWELPVAGEADEIVSKHSQPQTKEELSKSRTIGGGGLAAGGGAAVLVEPIKEATEVLSEQQEVMSTGSIIALILGAFIVGGALMAVYARWDDAGRPKLFGK